jgi:RNA polymerase sigma-70 factor (ECF subfamily)
LSRSKAKAELFVRLLQPLQKPLKAYCYRMLGKRTSVEDVIQSAVANAFAHFEQFTEGSNFRAWIFRFVTFEIFNCNRKHAPVSFGEVPADLLAEESGEFIAHPDIHAALIDDPDVVLEHLDDVVVEALQRLPPTERSVLLLYAIGEFSYQEIHELLSIPLGSVIGYLSRARKRLRLSLADYATQQGLYRPAPSTEDAAP